MFRELLERIFPTQRDWQVALPSRQVVPETPSLTDSRVEEETSSTPDTESDTVPIPFGKTRLQLRKEKGAQVIERRNELRAQLDTATSVDECMDIYNDAGELEDDEGISQLALEKALSLATTAEECETVYSATDEDSELERKVAEKQEAIFLERIASATTTSECIDIENEASDGFSITLDSEVVTKKAVSLIADVDDCHTILEDRSFDDPEDYIVLDEIYEKMVSFFTTVSECAELWAEEGIDSVAGRLAILKAAQIIQAENS